MLAGTDAAAIRYVSLAEYRPIAEAITGMDASLLARSARTGLAESARAAPAAAFDDVETYPRFVDTAAVLVAHLCQNHPLVDGNKRAALLSLLEFVQANGSHWLPAEADPDETERLEHRIATPDGP